MGEESQICCLEIWTPPTLVYLFHLKTISCNFLCIRCTKRLTTISLCTPSALDAFGIQPPKMAWMYIHRLVYPTICICRTPNKVTFTMEDDVCIFKILAILPILSISTCYGCKLLKKQSKWTFHWIITNLLNLRTTI
jgi:hypothetical protein